MAENPTTNDDLITSRQAEYDLLRSVTPETPCPYLPGKATRSEAYSVEELDGGTHERLMAFGFRRCGRIIYRPVCRQCDECLQLRVPVASFRVTRSMRRVERQNEDVGAVVREPRVTDEKFGLFCRYLDAKHDDTMERTYDSFYRFLYDSPTDTSEVGYYLGNRLVGVSILDRCPEGLSSVYMFFDPEFTSRSLGTFSILWELDYCRRSEIPYYYLGFFVAGARTMSYKARFRPNEVLSGNDSWVPYRK